MRFAISASLVVAAAASLNAQGTIGSWTTSGTGCIESSSTVYELFTDPALFDLDTFSVSFFPNANGSYDAVYDTMVAPLPIGGGVDTGQGDDTVVGPFGYGFTFVLPNGGTSTGADVGSNGHVMLISGTGGDSRCCSGTAALPDALREGPSFSVLSMDLNPTAGGTVWWDTATNVAYATWDMVPEFGQTNAQNCQAQFHADGHVDLVYFGVSVAFDAILVGWSEGGDVPDGGSQDFSAAGVVSGGTVSRPLTMDSSDVPTINETFNWNLTNVPPTGAFGGIFLSSGQQPVPIDLGIIGLDGGCTLQTLADIPVTIPVAVTAPTGSASLAIAGNAGGLSFSTQAVVAAPGVNSLGAVVSNEGTLTIGDFSFNPPNSISVTLNGTNTFNSDTTAGFWSVKHNDPARAAISQVIFDFTPSATTFEFDTDQTGMADRFDGGGVSTAANCNNTFRNGSDVATGLVFAGTQSSACTLETGWNASNQIGTTPDFQTLQFDFATFAPGTEFECDIDTDGGLGISGGSVGPSLTVTITLSDGTVLSGVPMMVNTEVSQLIL